jgi:hypothetical protein
LFDHLSGRTDPDQLIFARNQSNAESKDEDNNNRPRADSTVRFADEELGITRSTSGGGTQPGVLKGVIGVSTLKYGGYPSNHYRNLTTLSEISDSHLSNFSEITTPGSNSVMSKHKTYENPTSRQPAIPSKQEINVGTSNVSTASLEQWLQGGSPQIQKKHPESGNSNDSGNNMVLNTDEKKNDTPVRNSGASNSSRKASVSPTPHFPLREIVAEVTNDEASARKNNGSSSTTLEMRRVQSESFISHASDRDLSEDERFNLDYGGEVPSDLDDEVHGEYNYFDFSTRKESWDSTQGERTSLLGDSGGIGSRTNLYSGSRPSSSTTRTASPASTPPRSKLSRSKQNQPTK